MLSVILDLRHCREAKSRIPRACVNLEIDALHAVFCEADHAHEDTNRTGLWRDAIPEEVTEADHANDDRTLWSRKFASKKQNDLVENAHVILDLRHCREAKSRIPRACVNLEIDALHAVFCEADHAHEDTNRTGTVERCNP